MFDVFVTLITTSSNCAAQLSKLDAGFYAEQELPQGKNQQRYKSQQQQTLARVKR